LGGKSAGKKGEKRHIRDRGGGCEFQGGVTSTPERNPGQRRSIDAVWKEKGAAKEDSRKSRERTPRRQERLDLERGILGGRLAANLGERKLAEKKKNARVLGK